MYSYRNDIREPFIIIVECMQPKFSLNRLQIAHYNNVWLIYSFHLHNQISTNVPVHSNPWVYIEMVGVRQSICTKQPWYLSFLMVERIVCERRQTSVRTYVGLQLYSALDNNNILHNSRQPIVRLIMSVRQPAGLWYQAINYIAPKQWDVWSIKTTTL